MRLPSPFAWCGRVLGWLAGDVAFAQGGKPSGQVHPDMQEVDDDYPVRPDDKDHIVLPGPGISQVFGERRVNQTAAILGRRGTIGQRLALLDQVFGIGVSLAPPEGLDRPDC